MILRTPQFLERALDDLAYGATMRSSPTLFQTRPATMTRSVQLRAMTVDEGARSVEAVIATEARVQVLDMTTFRIIDEVLLARGAELPDQVVLLDSHNRGLVELIRGRVRHMRVDGPAIVGTLFFDDDDRSEIAWQKIRSGSLTDVSVGYTLIEATDIPPGHSKTVGGVSYAAGDVTLRVATKWKPREVSLVPIGADEGAKMRSAAHYPQRHSTMNRNDQLAHRALSASILHRSGVSVIDENATGLVRQQQEVVANMGDDLGDLSLVEICREALRLENIPTNHRDTDMEVVCRAVVTAALSDIFTEVVTTSVSAGYRESDSSKGWVSETERHSFAESPTLALGASTRLEELARGDPAGYATMSATSESYRVSRFAKQMVLDAQDIIDDRLEILTNLGRALGEAALATKLDLIYSILLANAALGDDGVALFHADHANLDTGTLSSDSLSNAVSNIAKQRDGERTLNLRGRFLLVPSSLKVGAALLLKTLQLSGDERIHLISESRLELGVVHPLTNVEHSGSATAWYLVTGPGSGRTCEVAYLAGSGRAPEIREYALSRGRWGLGWDVKFDVGVAALDFRGMAKSDGTS